MPLILDALWDPLTPAPTSYIELKTRYETLYQTYVQRGQIQPWVFPYRWIHIFLLIFYFIAVPPSWLDVQVARSSPVWAWRRWVFVHAKYPLFALYMYSTIETVLVCRSPGFASSYCLGLTYMFGIWAFAALFICRDARFDAVRLERNEAPVSTTQEGASKCLPNGNGTVNQAEEASGMDLCANGETRARRIAGQIGNEKAAVVDNTVNGSAHSGSAAGSRCTYRWQGLPSGLSHRAEWVMDLLTALRGAGWKHQVRTMASPPQYILDQLPPDQRVIVKPTCRVDYDTRSLLLHNLWVLASACVMMDVLKAVMMADPYFWGLVDAAPPPWLPRWCAQSPVLVRAVRLCLSGAGVILLLRAFFSLSPLFFAGILGPRVLGMRAEPWMYPDVFGDPRYVLDHGLAGLWGSWWQQVFRVTFTRTSDAIVSALGWRSHGQPAKLVALATAFFISGVLHYAGSYTITGPTQPVMPFLFFAFQIVGIVLETASGLVCDRSGISAAVPDVVKRLCRGVWVVIWMYLTAPYFADDVARGGLWLFEPVPVSFVKLFGFGVEGGKWWNWDGRFVWWHTAETWWQSGLAI